MIATMRGRPPSRRGIGSQRTIGILLLSALTFVAGGVVGDRRGPGAASADDGGGDPDGTDGRYRPRMRSLESAAGAGGIPSQRAQVDAKAAFRRRFGPLTGKVRTTAATLRLVDQLLDAAIGETDSAVKWVILDEARRLGVDAGSAEAVGRAVRLASAEFDFDALGVEYRSLREIPLRALDARRGGDLARASEAIATRAEIDGRLDLAVLAQALAVQAWQRTGDTAAARAAAIRHDTLDEERVRSDR